MGKKACRDCGEEFSWYKGKPGFIDQCRDCGERYEGTQDIVPLGGNMIYTHKTGGYIEVKPMDQAKKFAQKSKRLGAGVTASLTESRLAAEIKLEGGKE